MLIKAKYEGEKIVATHQDYVGGELEYAKEMQKDPNNGWSKGRTMRKAGTVPNSSIEKYEESHPGFKALAFGHVNDWKLRDKAIRDFMKWEENRKFTWGSV